MARFVGWEMSRLPRGTGLGLFEITNESINAIENYIRWAEVEVPQNHRKYMDLLARFMALRNQGFSRKMSFGPLDPDGRRSELAWRSPDEGIRRISQAYYLGWKLKRIGPGWYRVYNDSREAYFIEFGISEVGFGEGRHVPNRRIRRPVRKLALIKTMKFMMTTQAYHRVWADIYRTRGFHSGFNQIVQAPAGGHFRWEEASEHEVRGVLRRLIRRGQGSNYSRYVRMTPRGTWQVRRPNAGGGSYTGPSRGRRLP